MEYHPRIDILNPLVKESKIILGSFPTWCLTKPDNNQKKAERIKNGDISFFYGSSVNRFWFWYQKNLDQSISKANITSIQKSLNEQSIAITDVIISCTRKDRSALDKHLTNRTYNYQFFEYPKKGKTIKIICTSKGVMNEMLLSSTFFKLHPRLKINPIKSNTFQNQLIKKVKGDSNLIRNPFYHLIEVESGGIIECIALPSPGSPYRRLIDFGFNSNDADIYLNSYLRYVFDWFVA